MQSMKVTIGEQISIILKTTWRLNVHRKSATEVLKMQDKIYNII